jgi:hypothetical protein
MTRCIMHDMVYASFNGPIPQLHPLPLMGLGYYWNMDFAKPLPLPM